MPQEHIGKDIPETDGFVSDEDVNAISEEKKGPTGQDHSTDNYEETLPDDGVGGVQDREDRASSAARID